jgi:hypothetical protein
LSNESDPVHKAGQSIYIALLVQVAERMVENLRGAATVLMVGLADSLGLFRYMTGTPPATSSEIAAGMNLHERWVRELLYQLVRLSLPHVL